MKHRFHKRLKVEGVNCFRGLKDKSVKGLHADGLRKRKETLCIAHIQSQDVVKEFLLLLCHA